MGNFASNYIIPVFVQEVQHFSATLSGLVLLPAGIMVVCLVSFFGRMTDFVQPLYGDVWAHYVCYWFIVNERFRRKYNVLDLCHFCHDKPVWDVVDPTRFKYGCVASVVV